jgi:two-component system, chemotaxis family, response regulator Rcp1
MSLGMTRTPVEILLIEDDPQDAQLAREGLEDWGMSCGLTVAEDGVKALAYLRGEGEYAGALLPDLILLDLKLPKKSGLEVLAEIKADEALRVIPVIVLTTSDAPDDIFEAYNLQASLYITKPSDLDEFERVMRSIHDLCLAVVKLPPRESCPAADHYFIPPVHA